MMKSRLLWGLLLTIVSQIITSEAELPTLYSCVDWDCEDWISKGKTLLTYVGKTDKHLSFKKNVDIYIISKPVDKSLPDWIGKVGSKIGLVPKDYIREDKMNKSPKFKLDLQDIPGFSSKDEIEENEPINEPGSEQVDDETEDQDEDEEEEDIEIEDIGEGETPTIKETPQSSDASESESIPVSSKEESVSAATATLEMPVQSDIQSPEGVHSELLSSASSLLLSESGSSPSVQIAEELVSKLEISSDAASDMLNLQPSTDTLLQGTSTQEYIPETPKTVQQKPTDEITPRIPETVVRNIITSIQNINTLSVSEAATKIEGFSVSRVEKSAATDEESQTQFSVEEKTPESVESTATVTEDIPSIQTEEDLPVPSKPEELQPPSSPQAIEAEPSAAEAEISTELPPVEDLSSPPSVEDTSSIPSVEDASLPSTTESYSSETEEVDLPPPTTAEVTPSQDEDSPQPQAPTEDAEKLSPPVPEEETVSQPEEVIDEPVVEDEPEPVSAPPPPPQLDELPVSTEAPPPAVEVEQVPSTTESLKEVDGPVTEDLSAQIAEDQSAPSETDENVDAISTESQLPPHSDESTSPETKSQNIENESVPSTEAPALQTLDDLPSLSESDSSPSATTEDVPSISEPETTPAPQIEELPPVQQNENTLVPPAIPQQHSHIESLEHRQDEVVPEVVSNFVEDLKSSSSETPVSVEEEPVESTPEPVNESTEEHQHEHDHGHDHGHHHHHHHHHRQHGHRHHFKDINDTEASSIILVIKHLSSTLLSFLPEALQDTILDVDDALVFTGIIALTLVSICVPYFLIEGYMSVRPLKKKVVELNKSLWKVSAAYETQQEEFEIFKQKAIAHDEYKKRAEQSENDVLILKKLETKHREQITALKTQLKSQMKEAVDIRALIEKTLDDKKVVVEDCEKYKTAYESTKEALVSAKDELSRIQNQAKSSALLLNTSGRNVEVLTAKISMLDQQTEEMKSQLNAEIEKRKSIEIQKQEVEQAKSTVEKELAEFKNICHQYEGTVCGLHDEISKLESELASIKDTLGDDSPLLEIAEVQAKAAFLEKESGSLRTRLEGLTSDNDNLNGKLKDTAAALEEARAEREQTNNRLQVLEKYFKEREEEFIKNIEQLQLKESVRDKGKEELIRIIEEKENVCKDLDERLEALKEEFEETKQQHRNEIRALEAKAHENWLSLCQAERKAQDARKEAKLLRQRLTALSKEKDDDDDGLNGEVPMFPVLPDELVPLPILDDPPSYFGLGDFVPPPPLPEGGEREPHRPPPLGGLGGRLSPSFSDLDDNILSPIGVGRREDDCTDGSSGSDSPRRSPPLRSSWVNVPHDREGQGRESMRRISRATSSPIQPGANL